MVLRQRSIDLKKEFGERLKRLRKYKGFTQETLSEAMEMSVEMISNMERGINGPSFETLDRLSRTLNLPVYQLFFFDQPDALPDISFKN